MYECINIMLLWLWLHSNYILLKHPHLSNHSIPRPVHLLAVFTVSDQVEVIGELNRLGDLLQDVDAKSFAAALDVDARIARLVADGWKREGGGRKNVNVKIGHTFPQCDKSNLAINRIQYVKSQETVKSCKVIRMQSRAAAIRCVFFFYRNAACCSKQMSRKGQRMFDCVLWSEMNAQRQLRQ